MEYKKITAEQKALLDQPLPAEAVKPHPTKQFLSTIKAIYVTERLNDVFGIGAWRIASDVVDNSDKMIVVKVHFTIPEYGIEYDCFGGNDNADKGDAYKGAVTDAITKIGSWLGIGADVFKGKVTQQTAAPARTTQRQRTAAASPAADTQPAEQKPKRRIGYDFARKDEQYLDPQTINLANVIIGDQLLKWAYGKLGAAGTADQAAELLARCYAPQETAVATFKELYESYKMGKQ